MNNNNASIKLITREGLSNAETIQSDLIVNF